MAQHPDAVIFDVDGVLVDTEGSYIEAVTRTLQWLLVHDAGLREDGLAVDRAMVHEWKRTGAWNDDWDLSYEMYRRLMASSGKPAGRSWEEVRGIFEEIYNGTPVAVERYGVEPQVRQERGLAETERVLLEASLLGELRALGIDKVGIVTGRSLPDWDQVHARIPLPADVAVATMEDGRKPDPAPLAKVVRALAPREFVAVGDTRADLELVQRWNATDDGRKVPGTAVMVCPAEDEATYREVGAELFIRSLAELPGLLRRPSSRPATP